MDIILFGFSQGGLEIVEHRIGLFQQNVDYLFGRLRFVAALNGFQIG